MAGRKRKHHAAAADVPAIYEEMLAEAGVGPHTTSSPRTKRDESAAPPRAPPRPTVQTLDIDTDEEDDDDYDDIEFEDVDLGSFLDEAERPTKASVPALPASITKTGDLELNLTAHQAPKPAAPRRKVISKGEREIRIEIHKVHVLCLLAHAARRNRWCNDAHAQESLRRLLTEKMVTYLNPGTHLSQFGRTESLKNGVKQVVDMFRLSYQVTERGMRRALWAETEEQLEQVRLPFDTRAVVLLTSFAV
jgi:xeroderma pigmentosum group C-complementing protein